MTQPNLPTDTALDRADIIDALAEIAPDSPLQQLRGWRPDVAGYAQGSYLALLEPGDPGGLSLVERQAVALYVALRSSNAALVEFHRARLRQLGAAAIGTSVEQFPGGPALPERLVAILRHADLLTRDPGGASRAAIEDLRVHGLGARDIVTLAQLIAFLSFQVRVLAGLRLFAEAT
jgi:CMD domain protein